MVHLFFYIKRGVSFDFFLGFPFGRHVFFGPIKRKEKKRDATFSLFFSFSHLFSCFAFYFVGSDFFFFPFYGDTLRPLSLSLSLSLFRCAPSRDYGLFCCFFHTVSLFFYRPSIRVRLSVLFFSSALGFLFAALSVPRFLLIGISFFSKRWPSFGSYCRKKFHFVVHRAMSRLD